MSTKRYECGNGNASYCYGCYQMQEDSDGDYVRHEDYAALRERVIELEAKVEQDAARYSENLGEIGDGFAAETQKLRTSAEQAAQAATNAEATIAGLRADAERYRWIRENALSEGVRDIDSQIDAARSAQATDGADQQQAGGE